MSNLIIPHVIVDKDHNINLLVKDKKSQKSHKSLDLYSHDNDTTLFEEELLNINTSDLNFNSESEKENIQNNQNNPNSNLDLNDQIQTEKYIQNILGISKKKNKRKINNLKEGYFHFYGINPIRRYNFTIDRYNEDVNKINNITLKRIPFPKILSHFFDFFIFLGRILLGIFLIIHYYISSYIYKKNSNTMNKARLITYKKYLLDDSNFYTKSEKPSCIMVFICIIIMVFSIFLIFSLYFVMMIPNILYTFYLMIGIFVDFYNKAKLKNLNIYENMIFEAKLDDKCQLNDYIKVNKISLRYYKEFKYYDRLKEIFKKKSYSKNDFSIHVMLYGNLFIREHKILNRSFLIQLINFSLYLVIGYFIYYH